MKYTKATDLIEGEYYAMYERMDIDETNTVVDTSTIDRVYFAEFLQRQVTQDPNNFHPKVRLVFEIHRYETNNEISKLINERGGRLRKKSIFLETKMDYFELDHDEILMYIVPESI